MRPTLPQIVTLSLVYGRSFESLFAEVLAEARRDLYDRLDTLPNARAFVGTTNRQHSTERLRRDLTAEMTDHGDV
jgi:hypothetical protein